MRILDELGSELVRAARAAEAAPSPRRRIAPRALVVGLVAALSAAAVAAAASLLIGRGDPIPPAPAGTVPRELQPVPGSERLNGLDVPDPDGGPVWDVRTSRSRTGAVCASVGQVLDGELGIVGLDRKFHALPAGAADTCSTPQKTGATLAGARAFRSGGTLGEITVVNGVAAPAITRATAVAGGRSVRLKLGPDHAFLAVFRGAPEQVRPRVVLADAHGATTTLRFADSGEFLAPDPSGGAPWALKAVKGRSGLSCVSASRLRGPDSPQPLPRGAFNIVPASVPPRCAPTGTAFADLRRFVPRDQRRGNQFWWGMNPARTVVWGVAGRRDARVVLTGAGAPRTLAVDPKTLGFLAVLDGHVDPRRLTLTVDGRRMSGAVGAVGTSGRALAPERVPAWRSVESVVRTVAVPEPFVPDRASVRIAVRAADPAGGPTWALRVFRAKAAKRVRVMPGTSRRFVCFAFGVDAGGGALIEPLGGGRSRAVGMGERDAFCNTSQWLRTHAGGGIVRAYLDDPEATEPHIGRVVVAGLLGDGVRSARLLGAGAPRPLELGAHGTFIAALGAEAAGAKLQIEQTRTDGRTRVNETDPPTMCAPDVAHGVRVADPAGGAPWIAGRRACRYLGRIVDDHVVSLLDGNGYANVAPQSTGDGGLPPLHLDISQTSLTPPQGPPSPAEATRRSLPGRTIVSGSVPADVTSVTLRTPRDIRTLRPVDGVFLAVYDGSFYTGEIVATAHRRDGTALTQRRSASPFPSFS